MQFTDLDWADERVVAQQYVEGSDRGVMLDSKGEESASYFRICRDFIACSDPMPRGDEINAVRYSDFYTDLELRNTEAYCAYFEPTRTCVAVRLPSPPGRARRVLFMRDSTLDFTNRDVMLLSLLRPHIHELYLDAERRRGGAPQLTAREWEILQLAGEGLPNRAIGLRLFISPATVRKHMEHIFERLGVRNRTQAAAMALPHRPSLTTSTAT